MFLSRHGPGRLGPEQAHPRVTDGNTALLDVRQAPERRAGHAPGAVHLSLNRLLTKAALPDTVQSWDVVPSYRCGHYPQQASKLLASSSVDAADISGVTSAGAGAALPVAGGSGHSGRIA